MTGQVTYAPTSIDISNALLNGGTFTVTYTRGNDQTIDPTLYSSAWPATITQTYSYSDLFPTDAVLETYLYFTLTEVRATGIVYAGLAAFGVRLNMTGPSNPIKLVKILGLKPLDFLGMALFPLMMKIPVISGMKV